jgi:GT2 family glycosyltransferase
MVRADLLKRLGGFDGQFEYYYEDVDLCHRIWDAGQRILFSHQVTITHLGGQSTSGRFPIPFELDKYRNRYRYFYKYFGRQGVRSCRRLSLARIRTREVGYRLKWLLKPTDSLNRRLKLYQAAAAWNRAIDPVQLVEKGMEPKSFAQVPLKIQS